MSEDQEKDFIKHLKVGDLTAFEKALLLYERPIFNHVLRLVGHRQDAEDLTQDTFVKFYRKRHLLNPEKSLKSWLYKIATNTVYDWWRKKRGKPELFIINEVGSQFETIGDDPTYYRIERVRDLEMALEKIKPIYKTVLLLFYQQDFDYETIAETLELPVNTVKTYLYRAKKDLKEELEKNE